LAIWFSVSAALAHIQIAGQAITATTPPQPGGCKVTKKKGKGKVEPTPSINVYVTTPSMPPPPVDPCKAGGLSLWGRFKCNPGVLSAIASSFGAIASWIGAMSALGIGLLAFWLNQTIRKGQVAQEQMKMLLEIDGKLVDNPALWAVHGTKYLPAPSSSRNFDEMIKVAQAGSDEQKVAVAEAIAFALSRHPDARQTAELKNLAFASRYFNFFDFLYASYGKKTFFRRDPEKNEEWLAWKAYIKDFFKDNPTAQNIWNKEFATKEIYTKSFRDFMQGVIEKVTAGSTPAAEKTPAPKAPGD
jgi:hypothetical protein